MNIFILTKVVKETELAKVTLRKETPLIQDIDSPICRYLQNVLVKLKDY